jgi:hypothetical protein
VRVGAGIVAAMLERRMIDGERDVWVRMGIWAQISYEITCRIELVRTKVMAAIRGPV